MDVERYLLGSALTGVISQRLTKRLCPKCRIARATTDYEKTVFKEVLGLEVNSIYGPGDCDECINGYKGRIAIHEVLTINQDIKDAIVNNLKKTELRKLVYDNGHVATLLQDGLKKVIAGQTSFEEILRVIDIEDDFGEDDENIKKALMGKLDTDNKNSEIESL